MSTYGVLKHQHTSLQFSDPKHQQEHDVRVLFAKGEKFPIKTGTESGTDNALHDLVAHYAKKHNHVIQHAQGNWVAVDRDIIKPRSRPHKDKIFVVSNDTLFGRQHDREFPTIQFVHADERMGIFGVAGFHYSTHGRLPLDPNWDTNMMYAGNIAEWMEHAARGTNIALGAGDFNMVDKLPKQDWAFGEGFTSMADELNKYPNTGHGPIDGFVSYDKDKRVKAKKLEVLTDNRLHMFSDHYVCRGTWSIRHLKI